MAVSTGVEFRQPCNAARSCVVFACGGVALFDGLHVWTVDSATAQSRAAWVSALDTLEALNPTLVVAGHRIADSPTDLAALRYTRDYLRFFEGAVSKATGAAQAEQWLLAAYPEGGPTVAAGLGTKVAKGEISWG